MSEDNSLPPAKDPATKATATGMNTADGSDNGLFGQILAPGSSLHPTFLLVLDGAFGLLFCVFLGLLFLTSGNVHILALMLIEGCLWASVKWVVHELKNAENANTKTEAKDE
ncbi:hypothetical protein BDY19DRAFT_990299 [Irpex rosettiformis]|uniref:Uncharacterized protein n=1 Tax=Irpex rosettiformis TaxID=378272 RepID=A0ACB8UEC9_9APHY|nr:hypothetical protein BDY19DRAFT_990299 [Irpex rosettiformis]